MAMRTVLVLSVLAVSVSAEGSLLEALARLRLADADGAEAAIEAVLKQKPDTGRVVEILAKGVPVKPIEPGWHLLEARDEAGVKRPFQLYVPKGLDESDEPAPLLVHMHGAVSRAAFTTKLGRVGYGNRWVASADREKFAVCYPLGNAQCTWWSDAGIAAVRAAIRETKRRVPVDDDAIVATGFSDGGSGCYYFAMFAPRPFAAFLPMNGHPAVASSASGQQLYLRNLKLRPLFAAMTRDDVLYPAADVLEHLTPVLAAGALIRIVSYESGNHTPSYFADQAETFVRYLHDTPRDAQPRRIDWRCARPSSVAWIDITKLGARETDAPAVPDLNVMSRPGRVRLGFMVDREFEGTGVSVDSVVDDSTARKIGLRAGDVIVRLDTVAIRNLTDLMRALGAKRFGDAVEVAVRRGESESAVLKGAIPPFRSEPSYRRKQPTARLSVQYEDGTYRFTTRHVHEFRFWPVEDGPFKVMVNGEPVEASERAIGLEELLQRYAREADGGRLFTREISVTVR